MEALTRSGTGGQPVHLDTHVLVWLDIGATDRLSDPALAAIDRGLPAISPMVMLELAFLHEIGRLKVRPETVLDNVSVSVSRSSFTAVIETAMGLNFTRDPFDRIIVSNAITEGAVLISRDERIRDAYELAVW